MIPELANFILILSMSLFFGTSLLGIHARKIESARIIIKPLFANANLLLLASFALLIYLAVTDNFSVKYIASHSNSSLPVFYKISSIWSAHEGSMFLWIVLLGSWSLLFVRNNYKTDLFITDVLIILSSILFLFTAFLIFTSNPLDRVLPLSPIDGADINPILQDPGLAIHPPMLYMGYVGFVIPFAAALANLTSSSTHAWEKSVKRWTLAAWAFLTAGIGLGSAWAYYELGWGGYWFWDPVENIALLPWLCGTALVHAMAVSSKTSNLKAWVTFLAMLVFILSLFGAFIVRSGIIDSVHAFASDPTRGLYLLSLIAGISLFSFALFIFKGFNYQKKIMLFGSKESFISLNNILLMTAIFSVFLGVLYPLIYEAILGPKISVGPPFYNTIFAPMVLIAGLFIGSSIDSQWQRPYRSRKLLKLAYCLVLIAIILTFLYFFLGISFSAIEGMSFIAGSFILITYTLSIFNSDRKRRIANLGSFVSHLGFGLLLIGIPLNSNLSYEETVAVVINEPKQTERNTIILNNIYEAEGPNFSSIIAEVEVNPGTNAVLLMPEKRRYANRGQVTSETAIKSSFLRDIYINLGELNDQDQWILRLQSNYFISLIWGGIMIMLLGILVFLRKIKHAAD